MNTFNDVWNKLAKSKKYRAAFAREQFKRLVPFQIRSLRKQRGWSQEQLARNANLTQGVISRAEDSDYGNLTVNTILSIAEGFDVAFVGTLVPFSELDKWFLALSEESAEHVPSFEEENAIFTSAATVTSQEKCEDQVVAELLTAASGRETSDGKEKILSIEDRMKELGIGQNQPTRAYPKPKLANEQTGELAYAVGGGHSC